MRLLYITYIDFGNGSSGSSVRPQKMYQAFLDSGIDVYLVSGNPKNRKERIKTVNDVIDNLDNINPDICYIEPPSGPLFLKIDRKLIAEVHKRKIPSGLFYRDMYWAYKVQSTNNKFKDLFVSFLQKRDWKQFNRDIDILYFPTVDMPKGYDVKSVVKALPPGTFEAVDKIMPTDNELPLGFYVGGLQKIYGVSKLLESYKLLNREGVKSHLKLICREAEWAQFKQENFVDYEWLEVKHISGDDDLKYEYSTADFCFCPQENNAYNNVTMSVKFMEALSYLKPVIATNIKPLAAVIDKYKIGLTAEDSAEDLSISIDYMISHPNFYKKCLDTLFKLDKIICGLSKRNS